MIKINIIKRTLVFKKYVNILNEETGKYKVAIEVDNFKNGKLEHSGLKVIPGDTLEINVNKKLEITKLGLIKLCIKGLFFEDFTLREIDYKEEIK